MSAALANPLPGDYWTEWFSPVMVVIKNLYPIGVVVCRTTKNDGADRMFDYTKLDFLTKDEFVRMAGYGEIFTRQAHLEDVERHLEYVGRVFPMPKHPTTLSDADRHGLRIHPDYEYKEVGFRISVVSSRQHPISRIHELGDVELVFTPRDGWEINPYKTDEEKSENDHLGRQRKFYLYRRKKS